MQKSRLGDAARGETDLAATRNAQADIDLKAIRAGSMLAHAPKPCIPTPPPALRGSSASVQARASALQWRDALAARVSSSSSAAATANGSSSSPKRSSPAGGRAHAVVADASHEAQLRHAREAVAEIGPLRAAVFNVGNAARGTVLELSVEQFEAAWRASAFAGFLFARAVEPALLGNGVDDEWPSWRSRPPNPRLDSDFAISGNAFDRPL